MNRDLVEALSETSGIVRWLARRLAERGPSQAREHPFHQLARALWGHLVALEEIVFPALQSRGWKGMDAPIAAAHGSLKSDLAGLLSVDPCSEDFTRKLQALLVHLNEDQLAERDHLLPVVHRLVGGQESISLAAQVVARFRSLYDPCTESTMEPAPPRELVAEARVVLGSIPRPARRGAHEATS